MPTSGALPKFLLLTGFIHCDMPNCRIPSMVPIPEYESVVMLTKATRNRHFRLRIRLCAL